MSHYSNKKNADLEFTFKEKFIGLSAISMKSSELQNNQTLEQNKKMFVGHDLPKVNKT